MIKMARPDDEVVVAPVGPWAALVKYPGNESGDWIKYLVDVLVKIGPVDGIALHTYTRSHNSAEVTSGDRMGPPFSHRFSNFQYYREQIEALPVQYVGTPLYITECCPVTSGWGNTNNGLVRAYYAEIARWNEARPDWPIYCLALYRGAPYDRWYFGNLGEVRADWAQALTRNYRWRS